MTISLLVVSPSYSIREMLARYLPYEDFTVFTANSAEMALEFFEKTTIDTVLIELQLQKTSGLDFVKWLNIHHPNTHPVVICEEEDEDLIDLIKTLKSGYLLKAKLNLLQFRQKLQAMCMYKRGITYQLTQISIFELVKLVSFSGCDYHLYLTSPATHQEGLIYFGKGKVQHAMYGELTGEEAFYEIMKMKRGLFTEMQVLDSEDEVKIESSLDQLMANSALILDENGTTPQVKLPPTSCLIASADIYLPTFLGELFRFNKDSVLVTTWANSEEKIQEELMNNPELLIFDSDMKGVKIKKILEFIDGNYLDTRIILVGEQLNPALTSILKHPCLVRFLLKSQYQELAELIEQTYLAQHFSGELLDLNLFGVLQIITYFRQSRLLEVTDFFSGRAGQIFLADGEVLHATFGEYIGRDALKKILQINYGLFRQEAYWEPVTKSLNIPFNRLMMHLSRFSSADESLQFQVNDLLLQSGQVVSARSEKIDSLRA